MNSKSFRRKYSLNEMNFETKERGNISRRDNSAKDYLNNPSKNDPIGKNSNK